VHTPSATGSRPSPASSTPASPASSDSTTGSAEGNTDRLRIDYRAAGRSTVSVMAGLVVVPGGGKAFDWHGARVVIKASGSDTAGQLAVMESTYPAGLSVPEHHHEGEDELFYLLDGELEGFCGEDRWTATPGSFVLVPRDQPHGFVVSSATAARALVIVGPPRLDQQVAATGIPVGESGISE